MLGMCPDGHVIGSRCGRSKYTYNGTLLHFEGRNIDLLVTPEHKVLIRKRVIQRKNTRGYYTDWHTIEAREVHGKYNYEMLRRVIWNGSEIGDQINIGKKSYPTEAFLEFLGMYLGDGSCYVNKGGYLIKIAAFKKRELEVGESILQRLGVSYKVTETGYQFFSKDLYEFLHPLGHAKEKYIHDG
jgi:dCTP deaminase